MLIRYKKSCEKIAMGLLSFMPLERNIKKLRQTMQDYEENPACQLFMWKKGEDFIGMIGVQTNGPVFTVRHISVMPSYRGEGVGQTMLEKIQEQMEPLEMHALEETRPFIDVYKEKRKAFDR
ncbi:GNAT family N-acetyltransferase [Planococcus sp. N064]|uniref:GNAT family N-acetyltransferase n=1 Tax=Planococcus liqunii TaxID=3058394 RepID=A0ABT8MT54_9BACL|nr:GNAT family N-acetyltransferase [Planococcus sp. N064]MDN7228096.1 GNAT family N-acetyltransferase [Planococcus sp. N064]